MKPLRAHTQYNVHVLFAKKGKRNGERERFRRHCRRSKQTDSARPWLPTARAHSRAASSSAAPPCRTPPPPSGGGGSSGGGRGAGLALHGSHFWAGGLLALKRVDFLKSVSIWGGFDWSGGVEQLGILQVVPGFHSGRHESSILTSPHCFFNTFLLLAKPTMMTCTLQRFGVGLGFSIVYGALLTKTNRIFRIFRWFSSEQLDLCFYPHC